MNRRHTSALLCLVAAAGCEPAIDPRPPPPGTWESFFDETEMGLEVGDFASDFRNWQLLPVTNARGRSMGLRVLPHPQPDVEAAMIAGITLQRIEDGQNVDVRVDVRPGMFDIDGRGPEPWGGFSVVPEEPLIDGWYLFRADLTDALEFYGAHPLIVSAPRRGDVLYARYHVGSRPMWASLYVLCGSGSLGRGCSYTFEATELIDAVRVVTAAADVVVRYDGVSVECSKPDEADLRWSGPETGVTVGCPEPPEETVVSVNLSSEVLPDVRGRTDTVVEFTFGGPDVGGTFEVHHDWMEGSFIPHPDFGLEGIESTPGEPAP